MARARRIAGAPYAAPPARPDLDAIDFDAFGQITFNPAMTLFAGGGRPQVQLFPQGRQFPTPVSVSILEAGVSRSVLPVPEMFQTPKDHPYRRAKAEGFSGFRVLNAEGNGDWIAYLGAAYFRAAGAFNQYGASARGLAINSGGPAAEEFPRFSAFWLETLGPESLRVYALLEGESVTGAFRMDCARRKDGVRQDITASLFFRRPVETLGLAPLTSMFWYGEDSAPARRDWRPEIHDSDGLQIVTGAGEAIWRPLTNPPHVITNVFADTGPKGFGLIQRDRVFSHYEDDGAFYERRPNLWVAPEEGFGAGGVRLVELHTERETDDNIVAFYTPTAAVKAGDVLSVRYTLSWGGAEPAPARLARVVATRTGLGGRPGQPYRDGWRKVAVDFTGDVFEGLDRLRGVQAVVTSPSGAAIDDIYALGVVGSPVWRMVFDVEVKGRTPVNVRAFLRAGSKTLSETWIYQLHPEP